MQRTFPDVDVSLASTACSSPSSAEGGPLRHLVRIVGLLLAYTVQSAKKGDHIAAILALPDDIQGTLMATIEEVLAEMAGDAEEEGQESNAAASAATETVAEAAESATPARLVFSPTGSNRSHRATPSAVQVVGLTSPAAR